MYIKLLLKIKDCRAEFELEAVCEGDNMTIFPLKNATRCFIRRYNNTAAALTIDGVRDSEPILPSFRPSHLYESI